MGEHTQHSLVTGRTITIQFTATAEQTGNIRGQWLQIRETGAQKLDGTIVCGNATNNNKRDPH